MKGLLPVGFEAPQLGIGELVAGKHEGAEVFEGRTNALEPLGDRGAECARGGNTAALGAHRAEGVVEQALALPRSIARLPCSDQRERLVCAEAMALDRRHHVILTFVGQCTQRPRHRWAEAPGVDLLLCRRGELRGQTQPTRHPTLPSTQRCRDARDRQAILPQRRHHASLVHRRDRAWRRVRQQQGDLGLREIGRRLDHDRHRRRAGRLPPRQALESVDDLEAIADLRDADRHLGELERSRQRAPPAATQLLQMRLQLVDSDRAELRGSKGRDR
jgi:hypothetical protein